MPEINLQYYTGCDYYSDGDVENELLQIVNDHTDYTDLLATDNRWPILYHLSPLRRNLVEWYPFKKKATLLEVGAGCGALTGFFCESVEKVVAVELSKRRAEIISRRHKKINNLEIYVGNIADMAFQIEFDYITLIGVLEYSGSFIKSETPALDLLKIVKRFLSPSGFLIVAIENKFGLKYWAGAREDHTGKLFESLEGYPATRTIVTFGKDEFIRLLNNAAFENIEFYYPMPDYKLPTQIFTDSFLPTYGQIDVSDNYDRERYVLFDEKLVFENIAINDHFDFFANSFLISCK